MRRLLRNHWLWALTAIGGTMFASAAWYMHHPTFRYIPFDADAIVVLAGTDERAQTGEALRQLGVSDRMVVSLVVPSGGWNVQELTALGLCASPPEGVTCITPNPRTTRGEAQVVARIAALEGWDDYVLVTTGYHGRRAKMVFQQCIDADVTVVASPDTANILQDAWYVIHETGGMLDLLRDPECSP